MTEDEHILTGGNIAVSVVRIGATVRKPATMATPSVKSLLDFLQDRGYPASPKHFGIDEQGRQSLEFIPGTLANAGTPLSLVDLERVGGLIRELHEVTACFPIPADARWDVPIHPDHDDLICHNDLAPWNLVRNGDRWVFIDWDNSGPGSGLWDLAYAAITFPPIEPQGDITEIAPRVGALVRAYGLSAPQGQALPELMRSRAQAMGDLLVNGAKNGIQPWAQMYEADHAVYWLGAAKFIEEHSQVLQGVCVNP